MILAPGTKVRVVVGNEEFEATYERSAGGDDVIIRRSDGQRRAIEGRFVTPIETQPPPRDGIVTT